MGLAYVHTFIYHYLATPNNHPRRVNLKKEPIIIDANSFLYFIYDLMLLNDQKKEKVQRLTSTPFGYDGYWKRLQKIFCKLKEKCSNVIVVFDGVFKSNDDRRSDPERTSSSRFARFNDYQNRLPSLFRHQFICILRELNMNVFVAPGEADPMIVQLARDYNAYIVAADSDYHLYNLPRGYVPLHYLDLETFTGPFYQMEDVFHEMNASGVALWASVVGYKFVSFEDLQRSLSTITAYDREKLQLWLQSTDPDKSKREWITTEWSVLRFIQQVGTKTAYERLITLVSSGDRKRFNQLILSYINTTQPISIQTRNQNSLPSFVDRLFLNGDLDRAIIDILISRKVLIHGQGNSPVYFQLLLPIIQILLRWDCSNTAIGNDLRTVTYKGQTYEPLAMIDEKDLPSLEEIPKMSSEDRKNWILYCVNCALRSLQSSAAFNANGIHDDHLVWLCLLKMWYHKRERETLSRKSVLRAMIVSYLMHTLLDPHDYSETRQANTKVIVHSGPFLQRSKKKLKRRFSQDQCFTFWQLIHSHSAVGHDNDDIKADLIEVEQFYGVLCMVNQFFDLPIAMPTPRECISELCYHLAIVSSKLKNPDEVIRNVLFKNNLILTGLLDEIQQFVIS